MLRKEELAVRESHRQNVSEQRETKFGWRRDVRDMQTLLRKLLVPRNREKWADADMHSETNKYFLQGLASMWVNDKAKVNFPDEILRICEPGRYEDWMYKPTEIPAEAVLDVANEEIAQLGMFPFIEADWKEDGLVNCYAFEGGAT
ncbi:MAG: hypothetical protein M1822_004793 [Bathelium mastoideum]|nr:MAG: hypothetical protein M1822_004793 [Bathelium mastoideum]